MQTDIFAPVRLWLWFIAFLVLAMIVVGGATRLTGSGLSITEWRPFMGAIPPLTETAWIAEFEKYRSIPQYQLVNKGMSLNDFRFIYWWEWGHRQLGRLMGLAYMVPLAWFWFRRRITGKLAVWLLFVGLLGGFQAAIGWIMVASGLKEGMIAVAPIKLALHLTTACLILVCIIWTARGLRPFPSERTKAPMTYASWSKGSIRALVLLGLLGLQIALGALVAGSKAGLTYNTWPLMDGSLVPPAETLFVVKPWLENFVDNPALVQFNHRMVAYALWIFAFWHWLVLRSSNKTTQRGALHLALGLSVQAVLGIITLLLVVPIWAGLLHQIFAALVLIAAVVHVESMRRSDGVGMGEGGLAKAQ